MEKFQSLTSKAIPLPLKDVNTDMILPAQFLTGISRSGWGQHLFERLRHDDPQFPLNLEKYRDARIIVADSNFGCGSSREHAVWALLDWGIRAVIAPSFADIFFNNSGKNGLLLISLQKQETDGLLQRAANEDLRVSIDLAAQTVAIPDGAAHRFEIDPFRKHCLLNGLDDLDYILSHADTIREYRSRIDAQRGAISHS